MIDPGDVDVDTFVTKLFLADDFHTISGTVTESSSGLSNVRINGLPNNPETEAAGNYAADVECGWSGTVTPTLAGYDFSPGNSIYNNVISNQVQDYEASPNNNVLALSGNISHDASELSGVLVVGLPVSVTSNDSGEYYGTFNSGWSGTVTPSLSGYTFSPPDRTYSNITVSQTDQDYTAEINFNYPNSHMILPEVIWAKASGKGTWQTDVQIIDLTGGSKVSVYFSPNGAARRGPLTLWTGPGSDQSIKYSNILETLNSLDAGYNYFNNVGALEFVTQDVHHQIYVMARTSNGNYSKTFQGVTLSDAHTTSFVKPLIIQNLTSNDSYRSAVGLFNPYGNAATAILFLLDETDTQIGATINKALGAYEFTSLNPFTEAGIPYPANSYDNTHIVIDSIAEEAKIMCFGATSNNTTNDPAAHVPIHFNTGYENSPSDYQVLPEAIWAPASGGGTWLSEVQITDFTGGSAVSVYFSPYGDSRRGPISLWTGPGTNNSIKYSNILATLSGIDTGYDYFAKVGALEFVTQDSSHVIAITARTLNGNYSKTFQGINYIETNIATSVRQMMVMNLTSNYTYRSAVGCFNLTGDSLTVDFSLIAGDGNVIGSTFTRTITGYEFQSFNPFTQAGVPYPSHNIDNVWISINPISGSGEIMCFGATSNNTSNDPASHIAVQYE
jgi:hypothetical protein